MDIKSLVHMANQIGAFFEAMPDREEALLSIADHFNHFWEPRMRSQLLDYVEAGNDKDLSPVVVSAILTHRNKMLSQQ
jgi:formate dehydrogenase subunit delta